MIRKFIPGALALGLIASTSAQTPAAEAPAKQEAATPAIEVPAKPKLDPAVIKSDSSYALGFRTGGSFAQQFGKFGVGAADLDSENFIKGFMTALKGDKPELAEAETKWGLAWVLHGQVDEALPHLKRAVALQPDDPDVHHNLARVLLRAGQRTAAIAQFETVLRLNPNHNAASEALAALRQSGSTSP